MDFERSVFNHVIDAAVADDVLPLCQLAKDLEEAGEFERAAETLSPFWSGLPDRPTTTGLKEESGAELLLRTGALTGYIGSAKQVSGAQEVAKDLISESASRFENLRLSEKVAEARVDLAICYWREGALDEARVTLKLVLDNLGEAQSEQRLRVFIIARL
jgi:tetratricopeptide (TPR) repeat protein